MSVMVSPYVYLRFHVDRLYPLAGNLHLNIAAAAYTPEIESALEPFIYELVGGSLELAILTDGDKLNVFE
jgi:hypothetical protein